MNNNILPDLSTWHEVPVGGVIPAKTPFIKLTSCGDFECSRDIYDWPIKTKWSCRLFTAEPIPHPADLLPGETGSVIINITTRDGDHYDIGILEDPGKDYEWFVLNTSEEEASYPSNAVAPEDIIGWEPARIVPTGTGVLDETDKRDRIDSDGLRWEWWPQDVWCCVDGFRGYFGNLAKINDQYGPLRFAEEDAC